MAGLGAALLLVQPATAAPLCRDSKGLFTPCPHSANSKARAILTKAPARQTETAPAKRRTVAAAAASAPASAQPVASTVATNAVATHKARLCTDSKGLFTPCPH